MADLEQTDYDIVSIDWSLDPVLSRQILKTKTLQGNADPCLLYADPETIRNVTRDMVKAFGKEKYIANLGHGMLPGSIIISLIQITTRNICAFTWRQLEISLRIKTRLHFISVYCATVKIADL